MGVYNRCPSSLFGHLSDLVPFSCLDQFLLLCCVECAALSLSFILFLPNLAWSHCVVLNELPYILYTRTASEFFYFMTLTRNTILLRVTYLQFLYPAHCYCIFLHVALPLSIILISTVRSVKSSLNVSSLNGYFH